MPIYLATTQQGNVHPCNVYLPIYLATTQQGNVEMFTPVMSTCLYIEQQLNKVTSKCSPL